MTERLLGSSTNVWSTDTLCTSSRVPSRNRDPQNTNFVNLGWITRFKWSCKLSTRLIIPISSKTSPSLCRCRESLLSPEFQGSCPKPRPYLSIYLSLSLSLYIYIYIYIICLSIYLSIYLSISLSLYISLSQYIYIYIYISIYIYIYIYIYI